MAIEQSQIIIDNLKKRATLIDLGINPYPYSYEKTHSIAEIIAQAQKFVTDETSVSIASRLMNQRSSGKHLVFCDLASTVSQLKMGHKIQIMVKKNEVDEQTWAIFKNSSIGDWIGIYGSCFYTQTGELTIRVKQATMLCKIIRPIQIPKIFADTENDQTKEVFAMQDQEQFWRQPELDMLLKDKAITLIKRSKVLQVIRHILGVEYDCVEVETPYLNAFFGGANATPFTTYMKAVSQELYLPVSPEIELKRTIVGGIGSGDELGKGAYYIARNFRNEGVDRTHNPEFTALEVYIPFVDYHFMMTVTEKIYKQACIAVHGKPYCEFEGNILDFEKQWPIYEMIKLLSESSGLNIEAMTVTELQRSVMQRGLHLAYDLNRLEEIDTNNQLIDIISKAQLLDFYDGLHNMTSEDLLTIVFRHKLHNAIDVQQEWDYLVLDLFDVYCEPFLVQPCHIIKHPEKSTPLCKIDRDGALENGQLLIERFESFAAGMELSNAYSELNDPVKQRKLVEEQAEKRAQGDDEAMPHNELFLQAIEIGMPPCGGLGIGIDRMMMLLTNNKIIRDVIAFPNTGKK